MTGISSYGVNSLLSGITSAPPIQGAPRSAIAKRTKAASPADAIATILADTFQGEIATDRVIIENANMAIANMTLQAEFVLELQSSQADHRLNSAKVRDLLYK